MEVILCIFCVIFFVLGVYYYTKYKKEKEAHNKTLIAFKVKMIAFYYLIYVYILENGDKEWGEIEQKDKELEFIYKKNFVLFFRAQIEEIKFEKGMDSLTFLFDYFMPNFIPTASSETIKKSLQVINDEITHISNFILLIPERTEEFINKIYK